MNRLFGSARKAPAQATVPSERSTDQASSLSQLRETLDLLEKRDAHLARLIDKEVESARTLQAANKKREALECIKRKRVHDSEREQLSVRKFNLMKQESTLQALKFNTILVATSEAGATAIEREVRKVGGIEGAERVMDRADDALADASDLLGATSRSIGPVDYEEDELLEELEQLEQIETDKTAKKLSGVSTGNHAATESRAEPIGHLFAQVPRSVPAAHTTREECEAERELAELSQLQSAMTVEKPTPMPMMAICH